VKGFTEDYVHYLPRSLERGSDDGFNPVRVAIPLESLPIGSYTLQLEQKAIDY